eukprot:TRINITY_DN1409_c0_g1_i4.p2 TRINITY_DN1409_c0_g1~~TRINITY_DN1409_c0_g1_i4.p2  ORF type:complete len:126 (+),score=39.91 TRINITY_DN1409_c0_g1_i4:175-552(+)
MRQAPHALFERHGDNLIHTHRIPLVQALTGSTVCVQSLEGLELQLGVNEVVSNATQHVLPGQGMPRAGAPEERGDLIVKFVTVYPKHLSDTQKHLVKASLYMQEQGLDESQHAALRAMRAAFQFN